MQRIAAEPTFTDLALVDLGGPKASAFFERCEREIPFDQLAASVADVFVDDDAHGGAPHWPVVTLVKILFLQKCFNLSDPMAEEMLRDRISFRRFVGLSFDDRTPDYSTLSVFRDRLQKHGHGATLFDTTLALLRERGLVMNAGTLIDATLLDAPTGRKRADGGHTVDPCASRTVKGGQMYHGFRVHIATDRKGIITDYVYDTAKVSEHAYFDQLARNEQRLVIADSGYQSRRRVEQLRTRGVRAAICRHRVRGQSQLTAGQRRYNRLIAPMRAMVEHPLAWIKRRMAYRKVRYRGLTRNALDFALSAMACNWCRALKLAGSGGLQSM